jgi:SAM-dependent methyltransferase
MDFLSYNRAAWDQQVEKDNVWTRPASPETIAAARRGQWQIVLTPTKPVPASWFPPLAGAEVLCLASGGGQQGPVLAAAGARVTVFDNSPNQLKQDERVAAREGLDIRTELGDMRDLSRFADETFDLIVHPISNPFVDNVLPVWREAFRVLKKGGSLLAGMVNPLAYIFDLKSWEEGRLVVRYKIPYSDLASLSDAERQELILDRGEALCFGHSLQDLIGGQTDAGFLIAGFYEDTHGGHDLLDPYIDTCIATRAVKPG